MKSSNLLEEPTTNLHLTTKHWMVSECVTLSLVRRRQQLSSSGILLATSYHWPITAIVAFLLSMSQPVSGDLRDWRLSSIDYHASCPLPGAHSLTVHRVSFVDTLCP